MVSIADMHEKLCTATTEAKYMRVLNEVAPYKATRINNEMFYIPSTLASYTHAIHTMRHIEEDVDAGFIDEYDEDVLDAYGKAHEAVSVALGRMIMSSDKDANLAYWSTFRKNSIEALLKELRKH
jgi:hypothetical protein